MNFDDLEKICILFKKIGISELQFENSHGKIILKNEVIFYQNDTDSKGNYSNSRMSSEPHSNEKNIEDPKDIDLENLYSIRSPLVGTFYRATDPESPPLCVIGQKVREGDPLGLIESMKVLTLIAAPQSGIITEFCVQNGQGVEWDQILLKMKVE